MELKLVLFAVCLLLATVGNSQSGGEEEVMRELRRSLNSPSQLGWSDVDHCGWRGVTCSRGDNRVTRIQIGGQKLQGSLPSSLNNLASLEAFEVQNNQIGGPLPSFSGLSSLQSILLSNNEFTFIPPDFFNGMTSLRVVYLDYNPLRSWSIPDSLQNASALELFSATAANISGLLPNFFDKLSSLTTLHLSFNNLEGPLPSSFSNSQIQSLWLNGQRSGSRLNGSIAVLQNMTELAEVWLHENSFSGPLPEFSSLSQLQNLTLRGNGLTGPVPDSLVGLESLRVLNLTQNLFQGKTPKFSSSVVVDFSLGGNSFCLPDPGVECDSRVNSLLDVVRDLGYPTTFAESWKGNDPCAGSWRGITCSNGNITVVNFRGMGLSGTVSANLWQITTLHNLILADNNLTGTIPSELTTLPNLALLDVSNNEIYGNVPSFRSNVVVKTDGNVNIGKDIRPSTGGGNGNSSGSSTRPGNSNDKKSSTGMVVGLIVGGIGVLFVAGLLVFFLCRTKFKRNGRVQSPYTHVIHPRSSGSDDAVKINGRASGTQSQGSSGPTDLHIVEAGSMVISIQVLRNVTNNFDEQNVLGRGGFGTVYKGELHDGTKIAVKRMESGVISEKGLEEFKSEIGVLTKVRHRHLVALLGYCLDGNERLLVFEYMPLGTLSMHLFHWKELGLKPLEWTKRLTIALDVARGVEYLHTLAQQSFIHRDLKPSNILMGDDMRAKVADFGLVRLAPDGKDGKASVATKLAGTFGYLAPEYAVTGRVSTKVDVFSFGVILMELISGRKALDDNMPEESQHLVPWFRRLLINKGSSQAVDPIIDLDEETIASIKTVSELAGHCTAREPFQRPEMGHVVNVLSSLSELWKPSGPADPDDSYGIDYDMTLSQAVKRWQSLEDSSGIEGCSYAGNNDNTRTSLPTNTHGFPHSFTSTDGR